MVWALSSTLLASQTAKVDVLSIVAVRAVWAMIFFAVMLFALDATGDFNEMSAGEALAIMATGFIGSTLGETVYTATVVVMGMTRAFTCVTGLYILFTYIGAVIFLDESVGWQVALGSVLVIGGVYLVAIFGRPRQGVERRKAAAIAGGSAPMDPDAGATQPTPPAAVPAFPFATRLRPGLTTSVVLVLLTSVLWAISAVWLRDASEGFQATTVGIVRLPVVLPLFFIALMRRDTTLRRNAISLRGHVALAISGIVGTGLTLLLFIYALQRIGPGETSVLFSTSPLWALPMGYLFLREQITWWVVVGTAAAVGGIILIA